MRFRYRACPTLQQQRQALAQTFGCARVVFNDAIAARENAKGARVKGMRKSVHHAALGQFLRILTEKAHRHGRTLVSVDRWHASTQICFDCTAKTGPRGQEELHVREWTCRECGVSMIGTSTPPGTSSPKDYDSTLSRESSKTSPKGIRRRKTLAEGRSVQRTFWHIPVKQELTQHRAPARRELRNPRPQGREVVNAFS